MKTNNYMHFNPCKIKVDDEKPMMALVENI